MLEYIGTVEPSKETLGQVVVLGPKGHPIFMLDPETAKAMGYPIPEQKEEVSE